MAEDQMRMANSESTMSDIVQMAVAESNLAVAYELRTANLLALRAQVGSSAHKTALLSDINERL